MDATQSPSSTRSLGQFFTGLSGLLTASATLLTALVGLLVYLGSRSDGHSQPTTQPSMSNAASIGVKVANVYNLPESRAMPLLEAQHFLSIRTEQVCSNSVAGGRVREVLIDNGAGLADETSLVNQNGSADLSVDPARTAIMVKVSDGKPC
jgi:hypothetical protein